MTLVLPGLVTLVLLLLAVPALCALAVFLTARPCPARIGAPPAGRSARCLTLASGTGRRLAAWFAEGVAGRGAVLLVHGLKADRRVLARRWTFLNQAGFAVLAIDLQAHGESEGDRITFGQRESLDVAAALAWLRQICPDEAIGAIGISLGGAALLLCGAAGKVDAMALEAVFPDIERAVVNRIKAFAGPLHRFLAPAFLAIAGRMTGLDIADLRPIEALPAYGGALLLMIGSADAYTTIEETREMFEVAGGAKHIWIVEGAAHVDLADFAGADYRRGVIDFFDGALARALPCG
jgi:alpha-beta hydrolase superfamily lysophospholipase